MVPLRTFNLLTSCYHLPTSHLLIRFVLPMRARYILLTSNLPLTHLDNRPSSPPCRYAHCMPAAKNLHIVTASVEKIELWGRPAIDSNLELQGQVAWVGRSSMEIRMRAFSGADPDPCIDANFVFVRQLRHHFGRFFFLSQRSFINALSSVLYGSPSAMLPHTGAVCGVLYQCPCMHRMPMGAVTVL